MRVRVSTLPENGFHLQEEFPVEGLNQRMSEGRNNDIVFEGPGRMDIRIEGVVGGVTVKGNVSAKCRQQCGRCADDVTHTTEASIDHVYRLIDPHAAPPEDDIGITYFQGEHIDITALLEESLVLSLSPFWHPEEDAEGKCKLCLRAPQKFEEGSDVGKQSLGDALKKAGIH